ncbi:hypothetical protein [Sphingomonas sp. GB1N7]|uniref:hypothetical protein n=1 Tax=Parasphingomonas caseinilytica TaxID=3096158 RepID=UPI003FA7C8BD
MAMMDGLLSWLMKFGKSLDRRPTIRLRLERQRHVAFENLVVTIDAHVEKRPADKLGGRGIQRVRLRN